ncbi:hypothetical protein GUITHDRAFT_147530 [Guillardia theta CCMP2712]|uniref:PAS domain-containing protein n=1 Tax=Guillardia theta (strain CCMP2712) TaxID=905079 RepID=L1IDW3_GUITC|nr:hypothetical protein GUITHDRAFT_147530 [Guillardia theta CCMP2712]EKX34020.1 hypothetical protein GUITHDRAFT_147530 [Guillardia theta CCMP2712]|eukprot:XP_005821000.1 hypothetical protein GUITHDRAFT_147530 [Guillardia theta CCMP2712]
MKLFNKNRSTIPANLLSDASIVVDVRARSRILLASPQWISLFGFKLDSDVVGHSLSDLLPDLPVLHRLVKEGSMGYAREGYVRLGQQGSFRVSCRPVGGDMEDGDPVGCVLGFRRTRAEEFERGMLETREAVVLVGADAGLTILGYNQEALRCVGREGELNGSVTELTEEKGDGERLAEVCRRRLREEEGAEEATWETVWVGRSRVKVYPVALYSGSRGRLCGVLLYMREDKGICRRTSSIANVCEAKWEFGSSTDVANGADNCCDKRSCCDVQRGSEQNSCCVDFQLLDYSKTSHTENCLNGTIDSQLIGFAQNLTILCVMALVLVWFSFFAKIGSGSLAVVL